MDDFYNWDNVQFEKDLERQVNRSHYIQTTRERPEYSKLNENSLCVDQFLLIGPPPESPEISKKAANSSENDILVAYPPTILRGLDYKLVITMTFPTGNKRKYLRNNGIEPLQDEFCFTIGIGDDDLIYGSCIHISLIQSPTPFFAKSSNKYSTYAFVILSHAPIIASHFTFLSYFALNSLHHFDFSTFPEIMPQSFNNDNLLTQLNPDYSLNPNFIISPNSKDSEQLMPAQHDTLNFPGKNLSSRTNSNVRFSSSVTNFFLNSQDENPMQETQTKTGVLKKAHSVHTTTLKNPSENLPVSIKVQQSHPNLPFYMDQNTSRNQSPSPIQNQNQVNNESQEMKPRPKVITFNFSSDSNSSVNLNSIEHASINSNTSVNSFASDTGNQKENSHTIKIDNSIAHNVLIKKISNDFKHAIQYYYTMTLSSPPFVLGKNICMFFPPYQNVINHDTLLWCSLDTLFSLFSVEIIIKLVSLLLLDSQVLVIGSCLEEVTMTVFALQHIIKPFEFSGQVIPILPNIPDFLTLLESPTPFIIGVPPSPRLSSFVFLDTAIFIHLDKREVSMTVEANYPDQKNVIKNLTKLLSKEKAKVGNPFSFPDIYKSTLNHKYNFSPETCALILKMIQKPMKRLYSDDVFSFFVTNIDYSRENGDVTIFNAELFLASVKDDERPYFKLLMESQTFQMYIENRIWDFLILINGQKKSMNKHMTTDISMGMHSSGKPRTRTRSKSIQEDALRIKKD